MNVPWWDVNMGKEAESAVYNAVAGRNISQGKISEEVEYELATILKKKHSITTSSGSTALILSLIAAGAKPYDTVICPAYTWIATAHAAHLIGCKVEVVDILADKPIMDVNQIPDADKNKKIIIPVHMNGHAVDIMKIKEKGYFVIEDAAQALGSKDKYNFHLGGLGDTGCFSFSTAKIIGSGQGGIVVTDLDDIAQELRRSRTHGVLDVFAPEYWETSGNNFRYNDVLASILLTQIPKLESRLNHAQSIQSQYVYALKDISNIKIIQHSSTNEIGPYIEARVPKNYRNSLIKYLNGIEIGARPAFPPINTAKYLHINAQTPNALAWSQEVLYLPSGPAITNKKVAYVCNMIAQFFQGNLNLQ